MPKDKFPLGPPPTEGLKPLAVATRSRRGKWIFKDVKQKGKDKKLRKKWEAKMKKADRKKVTRFKWKGK